MGETDDTADDNNAHGRERRGTMNKRPMPPQDSGFEPWLTAADTMPADAGHWLHETDRRDWSLLRLALCVGIAVALLGLAAKLLG